LRVRTSHTDLLFHVGRKVQSLQSVQSLPVELLAASSQSPPRRRGKPRL
jgi:hypothetical protein